MIRYKINLSTFVNYYTQVSSISFRSIKNTENFVIPNVSTIILKYDNSTPTLIYNDGELHTLTGSAILDFADDTYIEFDGEIYGYLNIQKFLQVDLIHGAVLEVLTGSVLYLYKQNSENDVLSKSLTLIDVLIGEFNHSIGIKNLNIDIINRQRNFNYIYFANLSRHYYVDSVELISADVMRIHLKEDVLMTWKGLIKTQKAFVTRYENSTNTKLVDVRKPVEDEFTIQYLTKNDTTDNSLVNTTLNVTSTGLYNFMISFMSLTSQSASSVDTIDAPTGTSLNTIFALSSSNDEIDFLSFDDMSNFLLACQRDNASASYIKSVVAIPFNPAGVYYPSDQSSETILHLANGKSLRTNGRFESASETTPRSVGYISRQRACPYIITEDFTIYDVTAYDSYLDYEPNSYYEMYIAFVGWVKLNPYHILNKRLIVYYTIDSTTGSGTAYLYNVTDDKLVWSSNCQIGVKIDFVTSNALQIAQTKNANELNTIMGLLSSVVATSFGAIAQNPIAVAGGIFGISKSIASNINVNNQLYQYAQISFGSSEGVIHTSFAGNGVIIRKVYHKPISINETTYKHMQGLPYNNYVSSLSSLSGYVEIGEIHFNPNNEIIYQDEINEIVELLQKGVIF